MNEMLSAPHLTREELDRLEAAGVEWTAEDRERVVAAFSLNAVHMAKYYSARSPSKEADLISAALEGLARGVSKYQPGRGRLRLYITMSVQQALTMELRKERRWSGSMIYAGHDVKPSGAITSLSGAEAEILLHEMRAIDLIDDRDLHMVQLVVEGHTYTSMGREMGYSSSHVRRLFDDMMMKFKMAGKTPD